MTKEVEIGDDLMYWTQLDLHVEMLLSKIPYKRISPNGITPSIELENGIVIHFSDSGELMRFENTLQTKINENKKAMVVNGFLQEGVLIKDLFKQEEPAKQPKNCGFCKEYCGNAWCVTNE